MCTAMGDNPIAVNKYIRSYSDMDIEHKMPIDFLFKVCLKYF